MQPKRKKIKSTIAKPNRTILSALLQRISQSRARNVSNTYDSSIDCLLTDVIGAQQKPIESTPSRKRRPPYTFYEDAIESSPKKEKEKGKGKAKEKPGSSSAGENASLRKALGLNKAEARKMALHHMGIAQQLMREAAMEEDD